MNGRVTIRQSTEDYDWLGSGAYFWESDAQRAWEWAEDKVRRKRYDQAAVVGAIIDLGNCLDLLNREDVELLRSMYPLLQRHAESMGAPMPVNEDLHFDPHGDKLLRNLDCAVINFMHSAIRDGGIPVQRFDTVRGLFTEGGDLYPGSGFKEKTHVQIAVCNDQAIKGFFFPRSFDDE